MTIRVTGTETLTVTPEMAQQMLADNQYPKQRGVSVNRVAQYKRDMQHDDFLPGTVLKFAVFDGKSYLINGQHRLEAVIESKVPVETVVINMCVDTKQELGKLYYNEDMGLPRTIGQMFRSMEVGDELGVPEYLARRAGHAINFIRSGWMHTKQGGLTKDEILRLLMGEYARPLADYRSAVMVKVGGLYSVMWRSPVCALGIELFKFADMKDSPPELYGKVTDFWHGLVLNDGLRLGDPRQIARDHLMSTTLGDESESKKVSRAYQVRYLAVCWNAFYEVRMLNVKSKAGPVRVVDPNGPIRILGTTWTGEKGQKKETSE